MEQCFIPSKRSKTLTPPVQHPEHLHRCLPQKVFNMSSSTVNTVAGSPTTNPLNQATALSGGVIPPPPSTVTVSTVSHHTYSSNRADNAQNSLSQQQHRQSSFAAPRRTVTRSTRPRTQIPGPAPQQTRKYTGRWPRRTDWAEYDEYLRSGIRHEARAWRERAEAFPKEREACLRRVNEIWDRWTAVFEDQVRRSDIRSSIVRVRDATADLTARNWLRKFDEIMGADDGEGGFVVDAESDVDSDEEKGDFWA